MKISCSILLVLLFTFSSYSQEKSPAIPEQAFQGIKFSARPPEKIKASVISWKGHFGGTEKKPQTVYLLMSNGGFRAPTSKDHEKLIKEWLAAHPQADAAVIFTIDHAMNDSPDSKFKSVLVIDKDESLNVYLVRKGDCPGGTMLLAAGDETNLTREEYRAFLEKLIEAESAARRARYLERALETLREIERASLEKRKSGLVSLPVV